MLVGGPVVLGVVDIGAMGRKSNRVCQLIGFWLWTGDACIWVL